MLKIPVKKGNIEKALKMLKRKVRNVKQLEELRDTKNYSQSELLNTGYRTAILDAIDLVKKLTIPIVSKTK